MARSIFLNLPVDDPAVARDFYSAIGFEINEAFSDATTVSAVVSDSITIMLLQRERFTTFLPEGRRAADPAEATGALIALSADSREDVDALVERALAAGGSPWKPSEGQGPVYGGSFADPDGHVFEVVWMDPAALPGS